MPNSIHDDIFLPRVLAIIQEGLHGFPAREVLVAINMEEGRGHSNDWDLQFEVTL